ncbi:MAG TPA: hypothetical protein VFV58_39415 [Blastocatellia bacterium]|jgi:hypothetical protein|nr:hypothetical protein [Blastocatellia bacterium]
MTDAELKGIAAQALNMAKVDLRQKKSFGMLIATLHQGETLHRMRKVEAEIAERLGDDWLNSGATKNAAFGILRFAVDIVKPDAVALVSVINRFGTTPALMALPEAEIRAHLDQGADHQHELVAQGLLTVRDALNALVQTPERVCTCVQNIQGRLFIGKPEFMLNDQKDFDGRLKMFGYGKWSMHDFMPSEMRRRTQ